MRLVHIANRDGRMTVCGKDTKRVKTVSYDDQKQSSCTDCRRIAMVLND